MDINEIAERLVETEQHTVWVFMRDQIFQLV